MRISTETTLIHNKIQDQQISFLLYVDSGEDKKWLTKIIFSKPANDLLAFR